MVLFGHRSHRRLQHAVDPRGTFKQIAGLAIGFTIGLLHLSVWLAIVLIGVQAFLFAHEVPRTFVNMILPVGAALVALSAALAAYVMVKFYGVIFLGAAQWRDAS